MTLGEIIKEYTDEHSVAEFIRDSGLSKAYVYMLINNKNNKGEPIVPSIETIKKVAAGLHTDFDNVFNRLDYDFVVKIDNNTWNDPDVENIISTINENSIKRIAAYNEMFKALIDAAKGCSNEQIDIATKMLNTFKESNKKDNHPDNEKL